MDLLEARGTREHGTRHPWETARLAVLNWLIDQHANLPAGSLVLDIGCGDAFVAGSLAARFPAVSFYGIDSGLTETPPGGSTRSPNLRLFQNLDDVPVSPGQTASLVLLMDVLEHIEDDAGFLENLKSRPFMSRDTTIVITVPAYQSLFSSHDRFLLHYRRYSNATLRQLLRRTGLRAGVMGYIFSTLLPIRVLQVAKERLLGAAAEAASGLRDSQVSPGAAATLSAVLIADARLALALRHIGINTPGLSNYAVCRISA